jgi:hypothetical protein
MAMALPIWLEFEGAAAFAAANPGAPPLGLQFDAFNADTDGDLTADGFQLDFDSDGVADAVDHAPRNLRIGGWSPVWRFAAFKLPAVNGPNGSAFSPWQINDFGIVLYPQSYWRGGRLKDLITENDGQIGCCVALSMLGTDTLLNGNAHGTSLRIDPAIPPVDQPAHAANACWVVGDPVGAVTAEVMKWSISHEIGHILMGYGHPDDGGGAAPLPGTDPRHRLMCSGHHREITASKLLVKAEWDKAEEWLKKEEDDGRL